MYLVENEKFSTVVKQRIEKQHRSSNNWILIKALGEKNEFTPVKLLNILQ